MRKSFVTSSVALLLLLTVATALPAFGQRKRGTTVGPANQAMQSPLSQLPASDAVMLVNIRRLMDEVVPRVLANDPATLVKLNAQVEELKSRYGLDVRSFEQLAVGFRFQSPRSGVTTTDMVAVASGSFNSGALLAAGRIAAKGKYQEQKYRTTTVYVFDVNDQVKMPGLPGMRMKQLAVAALDAHTLVIGEPEGVRATIDAGRVRGRANAELIQLALRNPNAFISFGANVPQSFTQGQDFGNEEINKNIASIRQAYGALGLTPGGIDLTAIARTARADEARSLGDTLAALKQFGGMFISQLPADKGRLAQGVLDSLTITTEGNETQLKIELAQSAINELMRNL